MDINELVQKSDLDTLTRNKATILNRLKEIDAGLVASKRLGKQERAELKNIMKKINKAITQKAKLHK